MRPDGSVGQVGHTTTDILWEERGIEEGGKREGGREGERVGGRERKLMWRRPGRVLRCMVHRVVCTP